jgi:predicted anti-sigma-YlaC factor YlaD
MKVLLNCREATRLISDRLDRNLTATERVTLRLHLAICRACERADRQFAFLRRALREYPGPDTESR